MNNQTIKQLRTSILAEHSKAQCDYLVQWIGLSAKKFDMLTQLVLQNEKIIAQRAAWPMSCAVEINPGLLSAPIIEQLLKHVSAPCLHDGVQRNILRSMQFVNVPEALEGILMEQCFSFLGSVQASKAVKSLSMILLGNLATQYPDILPEMQLMMERQENQFPALKSSARRVFSGRHLKRI